MYVRAQVVFFGICTFIFHAPYAKSEVSQDFANCRHFFFKDTPPYLRYIANDIQICQMYMNTAPSQFATSYDTTNRIPNYSAYKIESFIGRSQRCGHWHIEPQLSDNNGVSHMLPWDINEEYRYKATQAVNSDYNGSGYDRGHLNPSGYHRETNECRASTHTLTNVAPQVRTFNNNEWGRLEQTLRQISENYCNFRGANRYFITGVIPSSGNYLNTPTPRRVNIPDYYWTAVCCDSSLATDIQDRNQGWSIGFQAENKPNPEIGIYNIQDFLLPQAPTLFRDYKDQAGNTVKHCLFNPAKADNIIDEIIKDGGRTRYIRHIVNTNGQPSYWQRAKNAAYSVYDSVRNRIGNIFRRT